VTDDLQIHKEIGRVSNDRYNFLTAEPAPIRFPDKNKKGGIYKHRALKDAIDILTMSYGRPLIFTYSSGFGALALQIKQVRENFCSDWSSLDWGKREWPPIGTIGEGGVRGVKKNIPVLSKICEITPVTIVRQDHTAYCSVQLKQSSKTSLPAIISTCNCKSR